MPAKDLISKEISVLYPETKIAEATVIMDELKLNALPLVQNGFFVCLLTEKELFESADISLPVSTCCGSALSIRAEAHLFDVLDRFSQSEYDILPVIGENNFYLGSITQQTLLKQLAIVCDTTQPGAIIRLEIFQHDFVLSELARLAEFNNARIINLFTFPDRNTGKIQLFLKVDQEDATYFLRSLERFNYRVVAHYHHDSITEEMMQERLEELLHYIEM